MLLKVSYSVKSYLNFLGDLWEPDSFKALTSIKISHTKATQRWRVALPTYPPCLELLERYRAKSMEFLDTVTLDNFSMLEETEWPRVKCSKMRWG